ncbi:MAG: response regulator transcription factor [Lachnospiraceae bacterium]
MEKAIKQFDWLDCEIGEKELQIISLVAEGLSNKEIAERLFLSEGTVRNYISSKVLN